MGVSDSEPAGKREKNDTCSSEDDVFKALKDKNPTMSVPKLRLWSILIERGHHDSYENPPDIPLISGSTATKNKETKSLSPMKASSQLS